MKKVSFRLHEGVIRHCKGKVGMGLMFYKNTKPAEFTGMFAVTPRIGWRWAAIL
jgi:hypothetical protein